MSRLQKIFLRNERNNKKMEIDELKIEIKAYYDTKKNKWSDFVETAVLAFVKQTIQEDYYLELRRYLFLFHKRSFGQPCIAVIEESIDSAIKKGMPDIRKATKKKAIIENEKKIVLTEEERKRNIMLFDEIRKKLATKKKFKKEEYEF